MKYADIRCDCCGVYKMAELHDGKVIIKDKRHRQEHVLVLSFDLLQVLSLESKVTATT
jgi:hypothetical protein